MRRDTSAQRTRSEERQEARGDAGPTGRARVVMVDVPSCPMNPAWDPVERKRRLWWHNDKRHLFVAGLAQALVTGDKDELRNHGIQLTHTERRHCRQGWRVAVLVESSRHGAAQLNLLPAWKLFVLGTDDTRRESAMRSSVTGKLVKTKGSIITLTRAWRKGISADVMIRATGGQGQLLLSGDKSTGLAMTVGVGLVIDFKDDSDDRTRQDTDARVRDYLRQGVEVSNIENTRR